MFDIDTNIIIQIIGAAFFALGLAARFGLWKKWYWSVRSGPYAYMPLGVLFFLYTYADPAVEVLGPNSFLYYVVFGLMAVLCVWWSLRPPLFMKPTWIRWIEKHPRRVIKAMEREVEDGEDWEALIESEESVDKWAKTLKGKLPRKAKK
jgi:hypothetical protein